MKNLKQFQVGNVIIKSPLILAPMAGISHSPFRRLVADFGGCGLFFSEMLSARHLPHDSQDSLWIKRTDSERPMAYQIIASSPEEARTGASILNKFKADIIDLNMACPAPNIRRRMAGSFLLTNLKLIESILTALRNTAACPVTAKIRLGQKPDLAFLKDLTDILDELVDAITLHPRLTTEKLKRRSRWEYIGHLKQMSRLPIIGNGDVKNKSDCLKMFAQTGCDGVMIGRAAVQKPWIFSQCHAELNIDHELLVNTYRKACQMIIEYFPPGMAKGRIKEFTWHYSKNFKFGHRFAAQLQSTKNFEECCKFINENFCTE